jgi:protein transport protein SEC31
MLQVKGLEFSLLAPHLLASGGVDGQLCIWDLSNPSKPVLQAPMKASPHHPPLQLSFQHFMDA